MRYIRKINGYVEESPIPPYRGAAEPGDLQAGHRGTGAADLRRRSRRTDRPDGPARSGLARRVRSDPRSSPGEKWRNRQRHRRNRR